MSCLSDCRVFAVVGLTEHKLNTNLTSLWRLEPGKSVVLVQTGIPVIVVDDSKLKATDSELDRSQESKSRFKSNGLKTLENVPEQTSK